MILLSIDPGHLETGWLVLDTETLALRSFATTANAELLANLRRAHVDHAVQEQMQSMGMPAGREVFDTVHWSGRFHEALEPTPVDYLSRPGVKAHLCGTVRAKDPNVRQALIDRYGGSSAIGKKATPGPLYGVAGDVWSALAIAITWVDTKMPALGL